MSTREMKKILVVDDDATHRIMLKATLSSDEFHIYEANDGDVAVEMVQKEFFDLVMLDLKMKNLGGIETLRQLKKISPGIPILIMTAYATVKTAVEALKLGAFDYLIKPLDVEEVKNTLAKTLRQEQSLIPEQIPDERALREFDFSPIIGNSKKIQEVFEILAMAAPSDTTILILGESGTGKELIADAIHQNSLRAGKPFVKVNCAALPENLLESELFGHEKGAFTGAESRRAGRFEQANSGTLFLDEIGDMSMVTQTKILRVIQEKEFERLGGEKTIKTDVRIIAATNKDLEEEVRKNNFRHDLYYRLSVVPVYVPPLRERKEDIPLLTEHFLKKYTKKNRLQVRKISPRVMDMFMRYAWPGNIRELENVIQRAALLCKEDIIGPNILPLAFKKFMDEDDIGADNSFSGNSIKEVEKKLILKTLEQTNYNITRTAEILGITRRGLQYKLNKLGIK